MARIDVDIEAEDIADAMNEDGAFMLEMLRIIAERVDMGMMRDNAFDLSSQLSPDEAKYLAAQFSSLSEAIKSGFNMANVTQQI
jgi:hypothetical protein